MMNVLSLNTFQMDGFPIIMNVITPKAIIAKNVTIESLD